MSENIANTESSVLQVDSAPPAELGSVKGVPRRNMRSVWRTLRVGLFLFVTVVLLQWLAGAYTAEFSGYPDEASHYMSGLLVRDYVAAGFPSRPVKFAENFYLHYPYLAIGHWPPLFYFLEGAWILLFSSSYISVMLLMALITSALATSVHRVVQGEFGYMAATVSALLLVCSPVVQKYAAMVMLDTLLALLGFWAVLCLARFFENGCWQDSLKFGLLASLAILTKGNGFYLALVPPIALLLTRKFHLIRRLSFWLPTLIVLPLCAPWHFLTIHLMVPTFEGSLGIQFTKQALRFYSSTAMKSLSPVTLAVIAVGFSASVGKSFAGRSIASKWSVMAAYLVSIAIFYCAVPAGIETRYFVAAMPPLLMFLNTGSRYIASLSIGGVADTRRATLRMNTLLVLVLIVFVVTTFEIPHKRSYGFRAAADYLISQPDFRSSLSLVSSETLIGEGMFISEVAMRGAREEHAILRATKVLADNDWNMTYYHPRFTNTGVLATCLLASEVGFIVIDTSRSETHYEHQKQLLEIVNSRPDEWKFAGTFSGPDPGHPVQIYRSALLSRQAGRRSPIVKITTSLHGSITSWPVSMKLGCSGSAAQ